MATTGNRLIAAELRRCGEMCERGMPLPCDWDATLVLVGLTAVYGQKSLDFPVVSVEWAAIFFYMAAEYMSDYTY